MRILTDIRDIDVQAWNELANDSTTATWFATPHAYSFYKEQKDIMQPFAVGVERDTDSVHQLKGIITGYISKEKNRIKQFFTRRAIIVGGPMLADDITAEEVTALLRHTVKYLKHKAIYIESRNFNSYEKWKNEFKECGFDYVPHLNFHVDTTSAETAEQNLGKSRKRDIKTSFRDGATIVDHPTREQVRDWYSILENLYKTKVHTPLFPLSFFESLNRNDDGKLLLVCYENKIIGGTACVMLRGKCLYEWFVCGQDGQMNTIFPSSVATYAAIRYAAVNNMPRFDMMGAGTPDEEYGVREFKRKFGGKEVEHGRFIHLNSKLLYAIGKLGVKLLKSRK